MGFVRTDSWSNESYYVITALGDLVICGLKNQQMVITSFKDIVDFFIIMLTSDSITKDTDLMLFLNV